MLVIPFQLVTARWQVKPCKSLHLFLYGLHADSNLTSIKWYSCCVKWLGFFKHIIFARSGSVIAVMLQSRVFKTALSTRRK